MRTTPRTRRRVLEDIAAKGTRDPGARRAPPRERALLPGPARDHAAGRAAGAGERERQDGELAAGGDRGGRGWIEVLDQELAGVGERVVDTVGRRADHLELAGEDPDRRGQG